MYNKVIAQPSSHQRFLLSVYLFHQNLFHISCQSLCPLCCTALHFLQKTVKSILYHILWYLIFFACCWSSRPFGIDKRKCTVISYLFDHIHSFQKIFLRFPWKTDNNIGSQSNIRNSFANSFHQSKILFFVVMAIHFL